MKKWLVLIVSIMFISSLADAQYKINKSKYDYRTYSYKDGDRYVPAAAGVASFVIPGLGQMISGEPARGLAFLGGFTVCTIATSVGLIQLVNTIGSGISGEVPDGNGLFLMAAGGIGMYVFDIWAIIDAVRVAKVNNLVYRDKNKNSYNFQLHPYIKPEYYSQNEKLCMGITLKVGF